MSPKFDPKQYNYPKYKKITPKPQTKRMGGVYAVTYLQAAAQVTPMFCV